MFSEDLAAAIVHRRSIRSYLSESIAQAEILEIVRLTCRAPSAWNLQPWRFVAVVDPDARRSLQRVAFNQPQVGGAPVVLALYGDMVDALARVDDALPRDAAPNVREKIRSQVMGYFQTLTPAERDAWGRCQVGIALGYLLLVLESRGYGSSPMLGFDPVGVRQLLSLPDHAEIAALVAFGKPAEEGRRSVRHRAEALVRFV